jgi:hypothetical protein
VISPGWRYVRHSALTRSINIRSSTGPQPFLLARARLDRFSHHGPYRVPLRRVIRSIHTPTLRARNGYIGGTLCSFVRRNVVELRLQDMQV